jgi:hypothetical protein
MSFFKFYSEFKKSDGFFEAKSKIERRLRKKQQMPDIFVGEAAEGLIKAWVVSRLKKQL